MLPYAAAVGEVGLMDEDGQMWIVDRVKELIKNKGFQVPPDSPSRLGLHAHLSSQGLLLPAPGAAGISAQASSQKAVKEGTIGHFWTLYRRVYDAF